MESQLNKYLELLNLAHDSILVRDLSDRVIFWNRGAEKTYGWTEKEAFEKVTHELLQTQFPQPLDEIKRQVLQSGQWEGELVHSTRDGPRIIVMSRWALKRDATGNPEATLEINYDITERKQAQEKLQLLLTVRRVVAESSDFRSALEEGLRTVCERTGWDYAEAWVPRIDASALEPAGAWYCKSKGLEGFRSSAASMTFPLGSDLLGQTWAAKQPKWISNLSDEPAARDMGIKAALAIPVVVNDEVVAVLGFCMREIRADDKQSIELVSELALQIGSVLLQKRAAEALRESHRELEIRVQERTAELEKTNQALQTEIAERRRDISEKVRLQEQLIESERLAAIGMTAARIGHELGNPLNGMSLTIQLLEKRLASQCNETDKQISSTVDRLNREVARLSTLLEQFRSLSRREKFHFRRTNMIGLVNEVLEIEMPRYIEQGIKVEYSFPTDLPPIAVDPDKMKQVILNLVKNAAEAMTGGGKVIIKGSASNEKILLEITDTGVGVPPSIDIFAPFFTTKTQGTGIGLTVVQQIIRGHEGSISYHSAPEKGTTFALTLPRK